MHMKEDTMNRMIIALALGATLTSAAHAALTVKVQTHPRSRVYLDGRYQGQGSLKLKALRPGRHMLAVAHPTTLQSKTFALRSPRRGHVKQTVTASFPRREARPGAGAQYGRIGHGTRRVHLPAPRRRDRYTAPVVVRPPSPRCPTTVPHRESIEQPPVVICAPEVPIDPTPSNQKVRRRNKILGLALANEIFNESSRGRKDIRKGAVAATLLNEVLTR